MGLAGGAILEPALVALEPLLDHQQRLVGTGIGIRCVRIGLERDSRIKMQRTVGSEAEAVLAQRDVAGIIAVEIFAQDLFSPVGDTAAQGLADVDALSRDAESHVNLTWFVPGQDRAR